MTNCNIQWNEMYNSLQWIHSANPNRSRRLIYTTAARTDSRTGMTVSQFRRCATIGYCILTHQARTVHKIKTEHGWLSGWRQICCTPGCKYAVTGGWRTRIHDLLVLLLQMTFQRSCIAVALVTSEEFALIRFLSGVSHYVTISVSRNNHKQTPVQYTNRLGTLQQLKWSYATHKQKQQFPTGHWIQQQLWHRTQ